MYITAPPVDLKNSKVLQFQILWLFLDDLLSSRKSVSLDEVKNRTQLLAAQARKCQDDDAARHVLPPKAHPKYDAFKALDSVDRSFAPTLDKYISAYLSDDTDLALADSAKYFNEAAVIVSVILLGLSEGVIDIIRVLQDVGANIDAMDNTGITPLVYCARTNCLSGTRALLAAKADVNACDAEGSSATHTAFTLGHHAIVDILSCAKTCVGDDDAFQILALVKAVNHGRTEAVRLLLDKKASINTRDRGNTLLMIAAHYGYTDMIDLLIQRGADVNAYTHWRRNDAYGYEDDLEDENEDDHDHYDDEDDNECFSLGFDSDGEEFVILNADYDSDDYDEDGVNMGNEEEEDEESSPAKKRIKVTIEDGSRSYRGNARKIKNRNYDSDDDEEDSSDISGKMTALMCAAKSGHLDIVKKLYDSGANIEVNFPGAGKGPTTLYCGIMSGSLDMVKFIIEKVAVKKDVTCISKYIDALDTFTYGICNQLTEKALNGRNYNFNDIKFLQEKFPPMKASIIPTMAPFYGTCVTTAFMAAVRSGNLDIVNFLLSKKADVTKDTDVERAPLMAAAGRGYLDMAEVLIKGGADVNAKIVPKVSPTVGPPPEGATSGACRLHGGNVVQYPIHYAMINDQPEMVKFLLEKKASVQVIFEPAEGTLLMMACKRGYSEIVRILIDQGDVNITTNKAAKQKEALKVNAKKSATPLYIGDNMTALLRATRGGHMDIMKMLIDAGATVRPSSLSATLQTKSTASAYSILRARTRVFTQSSMHPQADACSNNSNVTLEHDDRCPSLFYCAIMSGSLDVVKFAMKLLNPEGSANPKMQYSIDKEEGKEDSPIMYAAKHGDCDIVCFLLQQGAKVLSGRDTSYFGSAASDRGRSNGNSHDGRTTSRTNGPYATEVLYYVIKSAEKKHDDSDNSYHSNTGTGIAVGSLSSSLLATPTSSTAVVAASNSKTKEERELHRIESVKALLAAKAHLNNVRLNPLCAAVETNNLEIVQLLIDAKAKIPDNDHDYDPILNVASLSGSSAMAELLLSAGASSDVFLRAHDTYGRTPLVCAVASGDLPTVELLIQARADTMSVDAHGKDVLYHAVVNANVSVEDPFIIAKRILRQMQLELDLEPCDVDPALESLVSQVKPWHYHALKFLIEVKGNINVPNENGESFLFGAVKSSYLPSVCLLLSAKADVDYGNDTNQTPLMTAAGNNDIRGMRLLLNAKANVMCRDKEDLTALHYAARAKHVDAMSTLVQAGADINTPSVQGTPLRLTTLRNSIYSYGVGVPEVKDMKRILDMKADPNIPFPDGNSLLKYLVSLHKTDYIPLLLAAKADVRQEHNGETALMMASKKGMDDAVQMLLEVIKDADVDGRETHEEEASEGGDLQSKK